MTDNLPSGPFTPEIIKEQLSGKSLDGRMLSKILDALQEGDMIFAYDISRISRDTADLLQILKKIWSKKGRIKIGL
jgi:DNA invertase Pin-like site-specific DNA recombinase